MSTTKIKIKHGNTEIEIEGSEDFLIKYLNSLGLFKYEKVKDTKTDKKEKKKITKAEKQPKGAIYEGVIAALKLSKGDGMSANEIADATSFTKKQVIPALAKAKKSGIIKSSAERGNYEYVKKVDN